MDCKFSSETAETDIPGDISHPHPPTKKGQKNAWSWKPHKTNARVGRTNTSGQKCEGLIPYPRRADPIPQNRILWCLNCSCTRPCTTSKRARAASVFDQLCHQCLHTRNAFFFFFWKLIAAIARASYRLGEHRGIDPCLLVTVVTTLWAASGWQLQLNNRERALSFYARRC